ncbi:MAG: NUDIX hydrolase [Gammaproteobacteria bacterium]|nr:NUDIX hydrolase [Gammaproteobacteria bacterium]
MKYCSQCGEAVRQIIPQGDNRLRFVCAGCGTIHYSNPNNVCGAILTWQDKILLCRRAIEPRYGLWTLPAGFMENGETVMEAAARESMEEANAVAKKLDLFAVFSLPHISQVYLMFHGELANDQVSAGTESLETGLFNIADIPWGELAFPVINRSLQLYIEYPQKDSKRSAVHTATAIKHADGKVDWVNR